MPVTRRHLQIALGLLWLLDGALQLQPVMFTTAFAHGVVLPAAQGQPAVVADPVRWAANVIAWHPAVTDGLAAAIQLAIGVGLLVRPVVRVALAASAAWGLGVWWVGEGAGGLLGGHTTLLVGAPGAALLYVVLSLAAWPSPGCLATDGSRTLAGLARASQDDSRLAPRAWVVPVWSAVWLLGALLQSLPGQATATSIGVALHAAAGTGPSWLAGVDRPLAHAASAGGVGVVVGLVLLQVLVGVVALRPGALRRLAAGVGASLALAMWVAGQGMGDLTSGSATDPNAGLLLALLGLAVLGTATSTRQPASTASVVDRLPLAA